MQKSIESVNVCESQQPFNYNNIIKYKAENPLLMFNYDLGVDSNIINTSFLVCSCWDGVMGHSLGF